MRSALVVILALILAGVVGRHGEHEQEREAEVELAPLMSSLQLFSQKLGYSIKAENASLARFYLHELHEIVEEIVARVPEHDGHAVAKLAKATVHVSLEALGRSLEEGTWKQRWSAYEHTVASCNTCHAATAHGFIHILPAEGKPPFNQRFRPHSAATPK
jgi:hypothetical protein